MAFLIAAGSLFVVSAAEQEVISDGVFIGDKDVSGMTPDEAKAYVEEYSARIKPVAESGAAKADQYGLVDADKKDTKKSDMIDAFAKLDCSENIDSVAKAIVDVTLDDGTVVATQELYVVKIGNSWYVDDTNIDISALFLA